MKEILPPCNLVVSKKLRERRERALENLVKDFVYYDIVLNDEPGHTITADTLLKLAQPHQMDSFQIDYHRYYLSQDISHILSSNLYAMDGWLIDHWTWCRKLGKQETSDELMVPYCMLPMILKERLEKMTEHNYIIKR